MRQIDIREVQNILAELLAEVESGKPIVITQEGVPRGILSKYVGETQNNTFGKYDKYVGISTDNDADGGETENLF